jgi:maltooligosyltrehalose synthase
MKSIYYGIVLAMGLSLACVAFSSAEEKTDDSIFKYKKELSITDKQEKSLRDVLTKFQNYITAKQKEVDTLSTELNKLIMEKGDLGKIKTKLQNIARIQADVTYEDISSTRAIEKTLTAEQITRWRAMQEEFRKAQQQALATAAAAAKAKEDAAQPKVEAAAPKK